MKKINEKLQVLGLLIVGIVISSVIATKAATTLSSTSVYYDTSKSGGSSSNVNGAIDELYSLTTDRDKLKTEILNLTWPVGSIYTSIEDNTVEKVQERFGGKWETFSEGTTLVGNDGTNYITNDNAKGSGGSSTVTLSTSNLPSHSHDVTASGTVSSSFTGTRTTSESTGSGYSISHTYSTRNTNTTGSHTHYMGIAGYDGWPRVSIKGYTLNWNGSTIYNQDAGTSTLYYVDANLQIQNAGNHSHTVSDYYANKISGVESHLHYYTAKGSVSSTFTGSKATSTSTGSGTSFSVQNPYTVVYMYKRTA